MVAVVVAYVVGVLCVGCGFVVFWVCRRVDGIISVAAVLLLCVLLSVVLLMLVRVYIGGEFVWFGRDVAVGVVVDVVDIVVVVGDVVGCAIVGAQCVVVVVIACCCRCLFCLCCRCRWYVCCCRCGCYCWLCLVGC